MRRAPIQLQVYKPDTPFSAPPDEIVSYEEGRRRVHSGLADSAKHGKAIRMRRGPLATTHESLRLRGLSCVVDESLMMRYVLAGDSGRDRAAVAAVDEAWRGGR